jgi:hypothetical protein
MELPSNFVIVQSFSLDTRIVSLLTIVWAGLSASSSQAKRDYHFLEIVKERIAVGYSIDEKRHAMDI